MKPFKDLEVWFVTGSQHLYGENVLKQVAGNSKEISASLHNAEKTPVNIIYKPITKSPEEIYGICQEANAAKNCIGIMAWMHTFSPAKMWIGGLKILQKHLSLYPANKPVCLPGLYILCLVLLLNQTNIFFLSLALHKQQQKPIIIHLCISQGQIGKRIKA